MYIIPSKTLCFVIKDLTNSQTGDIKRGMWLIFPGKKNLKNLPLLNRLFCIPRFSRQQPTTPPRFHLPSNSKPENRSFTVTFFLPCGNSLNSIRQLESTGTPQSKANTQHSISSAGSKCPISPAQKRNIAMALSSNYRAN